MKRPVEIWGVLYLSKNVDLSRLFNIIIRVMIKENVCGRKRKVEKGSGRGKGKGVKGNEKDPILEKCCEWSWFCIKEVRYYRTKCTADGRYNQSNGNGYNEPL